MVGVGHLKCNNIESSHFPGVKCKNTYDNEEISARILTLPCSARQAIKASLIMAHKCTVAFINVRMYF